ncbi:MAG TPA: HAMP domain-containing sensor histidine kinase [Candidatus Angelobacter sp.]|nr:HAMP domain-containing sensor histidine kinase [Candidatus Angelobacter sp.]
MLLRTRLLLLVSLSIAVSVAAVTWLIEARTHESFRQTEEERTNALVSQFRHEFDHEGEEITRGVDAVAASENMLRMVLELSGGADPAIYVSEAAQYATAQRLDFLDLLAPDGTIISSAHWPARFGYKQRWFLDQSAAIPQQPFLQHIETAGGSTLAMLCIRTIQGHGNSYYLVGGRKLDAVLPSLSTPAGLRASIYSSPANGAGEMLGVERDSKDSFDTAPLMPLVQKVLSQHSDTSSTVAWGGSQPRQEIVHAIALPGYAGQIPAVLLVGNSLEQEVALEHRIRNISLLIASVSVVLGIIVSAFVAGRISQPVQDLAAAAERIGQGDWEVHVEASASGEIGKLASAFNHMTQELTAQRGRLVQSERVAAWRELARRLAHELKNPLFPLQITVENLLRARQIGPQEFDEVFRESTATLLAEIANLKTIIGRFSDFSKMPAPELQSADLNSIVSGVVQLFQGQFSREPVPVRSELQLANVPPVAADPVLIRRVIENLVLNAIDAMPQGGKLTFRTRATEKSVVFELSDTGAGLTPEECERLFTPYYTTKQHGTGLGLAIAQSVISDHHGAISVSSKKNEGTTFHIELPLWENSAIADGKNA